MLFKKVISPDRKRKAVKQVIDALDISERRACQVLGQHQSVQRYDKRVAEDEAMLTERIIALASQFGRYGYRRVTAFLRNEGWIVNHNGVPFRILNVIDEYTREYLAARVARRLTHRDVL
jgi:hypothetical protein